ncbi:rhodanese-like domain-containing protein [Aquibium oceanicum]|uniref:Rhodanese n=1 Tax=Aquibium oceanicum TaxID=1670800 RepID=A0A1L3SSK3_9HYPH|nr:rhodanese-like domain-containing protein [Aquibium oceanicum]APH72360.1 rhodanese [Aquibium oceanicum]
MARKSLQAMLDDANAEVEAWSPQTASERLRREDTLLVDLRDPRELEREGKIAGAFHCPRGMLEFWIDPDSPYHKDVFSSDKQFVFFCAGGLRSALAAKTAQDLGLERVSHIEGGFGAWKEAGLPHEPGKPRS